MARAMGGAANATPMNPAVMSALIQSQQQQQQQQQLQKLSSKAIQAVPIKAPTPASPGTSQATSQGTKAPVPVPPPEFVKSMRVWLERTRAQINNSRGTGPTQITPSSTTP